jgi:hypothetical protein
MPTTIPATAWLPPAVRESLQHMQGGKLCTVRMSETSVKDNSRNAETEKKLAIEKSLQE